MADDNGVPEKGAGPWGQAITAVVLVGALVVGLWAFAKPSSSQSGQSPARCLGGEAETVSGKPGKGPDVVSGAQLCEALNRPDLARLLGTPQETAKSASGGGGSVKLTGGEEFPNPSARVEFTTYTVSLSESYDRLPVSESAALLGDGTGKRTVLGRPAVLYEDRTISIGFRLDGGDSHSGPGVPARALTVARDAKDSGGSFDVTLWRTDGLVPDDAVLLRVAETVLPTVPGWTADE